MPPYTVIDPSEIYRGRTYSSLVEDWLNWFLSADADRRNSGPVVFLKSLGISGSPSETNSLQNVSDGSASITYADDTYYPRPYVNDPNVRIGSDRLKIWKDQAVLIPIITAFEIARKPYFDWGLMQDFTGLTIDYGDNPPGDNQLTIDGTGTGIDMEKFRILTPIFTAVVPETDYGRSLKDFLEEAIPSGNYPAIVEGYFVLVTFEPGRYLVHSWASAPRETRGPYFSELIYEIDVNDRVTGVSRGAPGFKPSLREGALKRILHKKIESGELSKREGDDLYTKVL